MQRCLPEKIVASDASNDGIRVVILYKFEDGTTKPIAHVSRTLLPAERYYCQIEKESLAIIYGIKKFHKEGISVPDRSLTVVNNFWIKNEYTYVHCQQVTALGNNLIELQL